MEIDEAGENRSFCQVDHFDADRCRAAGCYGDNLFAFDEDQDVIDRPVAFAVDQMPGSNGYTLC